MNGNSNIVKIVAQFGLAGVAVFSLYILWQLSGNHIDHNTQALQDLNVSIREMNTLHVEQSRILERLERVLDTRSSLISSPVKKTN